jgi:hypothetical protein
LWNTPETAITAIKAGVMPKPIPEEQSSLLLAAL